MLLRNICGLTPPATGWDSLPPATDTSAEANIARLKYYRNQVYGHANHASVDDPTFHSYWQDISNALVGLGADAAVIKMLKTESMDPVIEKHFQGLLREWKEDNIKDSLDEIEERKSKDEEEISDEVGNLMTKLQTLIKALETFGKWPLGMKFEFRTQSEEIDALAHTAQGYIDKERKSKDEEEISDEVGNLITKLQTLKKASETIGKLPLGMKFEFRTQCEEIDALAHTAQGYIDKERKRKDQEEISEELGDFSKKLQTLRKEMKFVIRVLQEDFDALTHTVQGYSDKELRTGTVPSEDDSPKSSRRVQAGTLLPPLAFEHKLKNIVTKTIEFEAKHKECVRVLPYSDGGHAKVHFYVLSQFFSGESRVPQKLKAAAQKCFGDMKVELQWFDLYNDVTKILNAPSVEFSSGKPKRLKESQVYDINETIKGNLHVLVRHHNITAVQASFRITNSQQTTQPCIAIYVLRKGFIPDGEFPLPRRLGSYPVDVVDGFWFRVNPGNQGAPWTPNKAQKQSKVLKLGASIGVKGIEASGSLGAIVEADGNFYALSCDHVMKDPRESEIIHPSLNDHLNYLNYHLKEYGTRVKHILKVESLFDLETHFLFDILGTESELLEKFKELKSIKESHRDPEKAKGKRLKNLEGHEKALEKGFREPRVFGTYVAGVSRNFRWTDGQEYYIDVAIARLTPDEVNKLRDSETVEVIGTGDIPSGECSERVKAEGELCKSGRTTGYTRSGRHEDPAIFAKSPLYEVSAQNMQLMDVLRRVKLCHSCTMRSGVSERVTSSFSSPFCDSCTADTRTLSEWLWMKNCVCVDRPGDIFREGQAFSAEGDSGAVLFEEVPKKDLLGFGIIFGEFVSPVQVYALVSPLRVALEALSSELDDNTNLRLLSNYND